MGKKGNVRHIKSINAPLFFGVHRKGSTYVTKQNAGRHTIDKSVALALLVRRLGLAPDNTRAESVIRRGSVLVNNRQIREPRYPVGLNDSVEVKDSGRSFTIGINSRGQIDAREAKAHDHESMLYKVVQKYKTDGNAIMLRLHDGRVIKGNKDVRANDSVMVKSNGDIARVLKLDKGAECLVVDGVHAGSTGRIKELVPGTVHRSYRATVESTGSEFETLVSNIMVTG